MLAFTTFQAEAQTDTKKMQDQLQEMTQEMQKLMGEFQGLMGSSMELTDTLMVKGITPLTENLREFEQLSGETTDFNELIDLMQSQMSELAQQDWSSLERMLKNFSEKLPKSGNNSGTGNKSQKRAKTDI